MEKDKALEAAVGQIERQFGKGSIMRLGDDSAGVQVGVIPTGALVEKKLYQREKRPYFPHVTVARAKGRVRLDPAEIHPEIVKFTAVRVTLYNSILNPAGALHEPLKTVRLI